MNWRLSALDKYTLVSNSDAHSPSKLGREANIINAGLDYPSLYKACLLYTSQSILKAKLATILALLRGLLFSGILVYLLPLLWGLDGVWWAMGIAEFLVAILLIPLRCSHKKNS